MEEQDVVRRRGKRWRQEPRPRIRPPRTRAEISSIAMAIFGLVALLVVTFYWWEQLPAIIPTHFGLDGQPNSYGPRESFFLLPGILFIILVMFAVLSRYPWLFNFPVAITQENAARQYRRGRLLLAGVSAAVTWLFVFIQSQSIEVALGNTATLGGTFSPFFVIVTLVLFPLIMIGVIVVWVTRGK